MAQDMERTDLEQFPPSIRPLAMIRQEPSRDLLIFRLSILCGLYPLRENSSRHGLYCLVMQIIIVCCNAAAIYYCYTCEKKIRLNLELITYAVVYLSEALTASTFFIHIAVIHNERDMINTLVNHDLTDPINHSTWRSMVKGLFLWLTRFVLLIKTYRAFHRPWKYPEEFFSLIFELQTYLIILQFCEFLSMFNTRLQSAVDNVTMNHADYGTHYKLVGSLKRINDIFGRQILVSLFRIFSRSLNGLYWIVQTLLSHGSFRNYLVFLSIHSLTVLLGAYQLNLLIHHITQVSTTVKLFNSKIKSYLRRSPQLYFDRRLLLYAYMENDVEFTAAGFLNLDRPLITSIMTAAVTYSVIMVQFTPIY